MYTLRKNDMFFCGDATINAEKCHDCKYYSQAIAWKKAVDVFLQINERIKVISPSQITKQYWKDAHAWYKKEIRVIPHKVSKGIYARDHRDIKDINKIKIAFVGHAINTKGWDKFIECYNHLKHTNDQYLFYHFGNPQTGVEDNIISVKVSIKEDGPTAMIDKLREYGIDCVVLFSSCPETYSYTYYECSAAGCFVITNKNTGNIQDQVTRFNNGVVLDDTSESLLHYLENTSQVRTEINRYRKSGFQAPLDLVNNTEYLEMLDYNSNAKIMDCKRSIVDVGKALVLSLLYRIRYAREL